MNSLIKIQGESGLYKDARSGGVIATDAAFNRYKAERSKRLQDVSQNTRINRLEQQISELRSDMNEILSILRSK